MKRKIGLLFGLLLGLGAFGGVVVSANHVQSHEAPIVAYAEGEDETPEEEVFECSVVFDTFQHGKVSADKVEGHVGDVVTLTAKHDLFYLVDFVAVNGTNLVEDENTSGKFVFTLVEGENKVTANFVVDVELLGEFAEMYEQAANKDWTNLFSVKNVVTIVSFLLSSGILIVIVRYFIKDKKLAAHVEKQVKESVEKIIPESTKAAVIKETETILNPMFAAIQGNQELIVKVSASLIKCIALMQENTPEAKTAILNELANLPIGDNKVIDEAKKIIEEYAAQKMAELNEMLSKLDSIANQNQEVVNKVEQIVDNKPAEAPVVEEKDTKQATE